MKKRISQKDIARALDISSVTVQRAFSNTSYVSSDLKEKIFSYAEEHGYKVSRTAQALVSKEVRRIAIMSPEKPVYFWKDVENGVHSALKHIEEFNYSVAYHRIPAGDTDFFMKTLKKLHDENYKIVGLVCQNHYDMDRVTAFLEEIKMPYLFFNDKSQSYKEIGFIGPDNAEGGGLAANFLATARLHTRRLVILNYLDHGSGLNEDNNYQREKGFRDYLHRKHPTITYSMHTFSPIGSKEQKEEILYQFLKSEWDDYDGIYYLSSEHSLFVNAMRRLKKQGQKPVVTHDYHEEMASYLEEGYFTAVVYQNPFIQGYYTTLYCAEYIDKKKRPDKWVDVHHALIMDANKHLYCNNTLLA